MRFIAQFSKQHDELPLAELGSVLGSEQSDFCFVESLGSGVVFESGMVDFSRLAFTREVSELVSRADLGGLGALGSDVPSFEGSFAVRCKVLDGKDYDTGGLESRIGEVVEDASGNGVDLDSPDEVFYAYVYQGEVFLGRRVWERGSFEDRRSHLRPFSSPVSMHPKLARALVNLSGAEPGSTILDPMCGTGGILIEAGLVGFKPYGLDIEEEMVEGARENLEHYGVSAELRRGDVRNASDFFDRRFDAVVCDLPYGRASRTEGEKDELIQAFLREARKLSCGRIVFMSDREKIRDLEPEFEIYVHSSLTRYIYVLDG
ncbi:MAG: methyltransferase domain-containing protein [Candidatus Nanohaloarchaeota archaeon QJJ-9]|nr:methyltransferase domain-containing protein [Candidatus Nanohaloarchaeota archaeon QJJ-9]